MDSMDLTVKSSNKFEPKSDWYCINLHPEGSLCNGWKFKDLGDVMDLYDEDGNYFKTLYHNSKLKKKIMSQYDKIIQKE